jgi:hypothetical protein
MDTNSFLSKTENEKIQSFNEQLKDIAEENQQLTENADKTRELKYKRFKLLHSALSKELAKVKNLEEAYSLATQKGGKIEINFFVHPSEKDAISMKADMSNNITGRNGGLLSYRKLCTGNWFGYIRGAINAQLRILEQQNQEEFRKYQIELRKQAEEA